MKISERKYHRIIKAINKLIKLADGGSVPEGELGICYNLTEITRYDCYPIVEQLSPSWEYCVKLSTGEPFGVSPIPENFEQGKWEGDNLIMRLSLLEHIRVNLHTFEESNDD